MTKEEIIENLKYQNKKFFGGQSQALTEAIKLIENMEKECEEYRQGGYKEGYDDGYSKGWDDGYAEGWG